MGFFDDVYEAEAKEKALKKKFQKRPITAKDAIPDKTPDGLKYKKFPTLYSKGSKGETRVWEISAVEETERLCNIISTYGTEGGRMQTAVMPITEGKNIGRSNETTVWEQAVSEAESTWKKKKDKGYTEEGEQRTTILPMLASKLLDRMKVGKMQWPVYVQPKFDGVRCLAQKISDTEIRYTSRMGKEYTTLDHLNASLLKVMQVGEIFDGELYSHDLEFEEIISQVKRSLGDRSEFETEIKLFLYDVVNTEAGYKQRYLRLAQALEQCDKRYFELCPTVEAACFSEVKELHDKFIEQGFEGAMARTFSGKYRCDYRSPDLMKYKEFVDEEFEICTTFEGMGKDAGTAIFQVRNATNHLFKVRPKGTLEQRKKYWKQKNELVGKMLTVRYQNLTEDGIPRFGVGIAIRDYE